MSKAIEIYDPQLVEELRESVPTRTRDMHSPSDFGDDQTIGAQVKLHGTPLVGAKDGSHGIYWGWIPHGWIVAVKKDKVPPGMSVMEFIYKINTEGFRNWEVSKLLAYPTLESLKEEWELD